MAELLGTVLDDVLLIQNNNLLTIAQEPLVPIRQVLDVKQDTKNLPYKIKSKPVSNEPIHGKLCF